MGDLKGAKAAGFPGQDGFEPEYLLRLLSDELRISYEGIPAFPLSPYVSM